MLYENIIKSILNYINKKYTDYAILLEGVWGTGKTFFIKNIFPKEYQDNTKKEFNHIYMSAAGINDIEQFINDIYCSLPIKKLSYTNDTYANIYNNKNIIKSLFNLIPIIGDNIKQSIYDISEHIVKEAINFSDIVIIIDDIERISDTINIEDFLYKIYDTFILNNLKVIFVCNEKEIYSHNSEKKSKYFKIKEKVIRHTIDFYMLDNSMFGEIIKSIIKDNEKYYYYKNFINDNSHIEKLINIFVEMNHLNIRTFLTYLDLAENLFSIELLLENKEFFEKILFELSLILIEIINGNENKIEMFYNDDNNKGDFYDYGLKILNLNIFTYYYMDKDYNLFNTLKNYIKTGYLDKNEINNSYFKQKHKIERNDFGIYYDKLLNESNYKPDEIKKAINIVFDKIKECLNDGDKIETKYTYEYIRDFNNLKKYIDLYDENNYRKEIEKYIELEKKIWDYYFDNLDLNIDVKIEKTVFDYDFYHHNKKYTKSTYKNNRMYKIDEYYEDKLNNAYKKAKENIKNKLIKKFENKEIDNYIDFNSTINRFIVFNFVMNYDFLKELEINAYNIDIIIKLIHNNILNINNASDFFDGYNIQLKEVKKYLNYDKIKNINYDDNTNKKIEELKSVIVKAEEHIKYNK